MKKALALLLVVALAGVAGAVAIPAFAATRTVKLGDNFFKPKRVTVHRGTKVIFKWTGDAPHNVTVTRGPRKFHSSTKSRGRYTVTPHRRGTYRIVCTIHSGMTMTLKVR